MYLLMFVQQLIAASTHIVAKSVTDTLHPTMVVLLRAFFSCIFYGSWMIIRRSHIKRIDVEDRVPILLLGLLNIPLNQLLFVWGVQLGSAPNAALAYALSPAFVLVIMAVLMREQPSWTKRIGVAIAFLGTALVLVDKGARLSSDLFFGNIVVLCASLAWSFYTVYGRRLAIKYGAFYLTALTMFAGTIMYIPLYALMPVPFDSTPLTTVVDGVDPVMTWLQLVYLGMVTSGLGFGLWYYALTHWDPAKVSVFNNLQPILTTILAFLLFSQVPTPMFVVGGAIALTGVIVTQRG